jgi:putative membrane protein
LIAAIGARDLGIWALEVVPIAIVVPVLWCTRRWLRFTPLLYGLIAAHCLVLIIGAHWTYEHVPAGNWLNDALGWQRNDYDRLGHLMQGLVPAIIAREVLLRLNVLNQRKWLPFLVLSICLGISAFYELIEWWTALAVGGAANDFLGSQGDVWDTQSDMCLALIGAVCALVFLSALHNRALRNLKEPAA